MRKTSVFAALTVGLAGAATLGGSAQAAPSTEAEGAEPESAGPAPLAPLPPSEPAPAGDADEPEPTDSSAEPPDSGSEPASAPQPSRARELTVPAQRLPGATLFPDPARDAASLERQGDERPDARREGASVSLERMFAEDWWSHARPLFEFHGYFRTRMHLFHDFALGRLDDPNRALYPQPSDNQYESIVGNIAGSTVGPVLCSTDESSSTVVADGTALRGCQNSSQTGANMRFRLNPTLHVSDNLRINTQIDILDNLVFGSTPEGYALTPSSDGNYDALARGGYLLNGYLDDTQVPPTSGVNGLQDSLSVKRAWAEYSTPLGELRFGRMPNHWGLGMLYNAGDGHDDDAQSTVDRVMFASGIKLLDLVIAGVMDFPNEGATTQVPVTGGEAYDRAQQDDVDQFGLMLLRSKSPELQKLELSRDNLVFNSGLYLNYRRQRLANDQPGNTGANVPGVDAATLANDGFSRRDVSLWAPDVWLQLLYQKLRVELEIAAVIGSVASTSTVPNNSSDFLEGQQTENKLRQYGFALELQQKLVEDRLRLNFKTGWASGDPDAFDPNTVGDLIPGAGEQQVNDDTISTFRFHPSYRVDAILNRFILQRVQGTYYFNPSLDYDFTRDPNGQRLGGGVSITWTRASEFVQTPGHDADLGLELGGSLYFQSKDGAINDDPSEPGGFFGQLQYAVMFPLDGMGYQAVTQSTLAVDTSAAQMLRVYLGVIF